MTTASRNWLGSTFRIQLIWQHFFRSFRSRLEVRNTADLGIFLEAFLEALVFLGAAAIKAADIVSVGRR